MSINFRFMYSISVNNDYFTVDFTNSSTYTNKFNNGELFFIIVHGWLGDCYHDWPLELINVIFAKYNKTVNICCLDWSIVASCSYFYDAEYYIYEVGDYLATVIQIILTNIGLALELIQLIGHSFGGHIIGFAGKLIKNITYCLGESYE